LALADRGYVLSNGRVVAQGPTGALKADTEMMQRYLAVT
jgi:ABC-type branched-subunit amino acid transport system ATPase component